MSTPACADCRFLKPVTGEQRNEGAKVIGECRRRAPEFNRASVYARWPEVTEHGWCGEFEPHPVPADLFDRAGA